MTNFDIILSVPDVLSRSVLVEWLKLGDLVNLDQSYCSHTSRPQFHAIMGGPEAYYSKQHPHYLHNLLGYLSWLNKRSIHVASIQLPRELALAPQLHSQLCDEFLCKSGSTLRQIDFQSLVTGPNTKYNCVEDVLSHCPNLVDLNLPRGCEPSVAFLRSLSTTCPHLEELNILAPVQWEGFGDNESIKWTFPSLKRLELSSGVVSAVVFVQLAAVTPKLESLSIYNTLSADFVLPRTAKIWNSLTALEICDVALTDSLVFAILSRNPQLQSLTLQNTSYPFSDLTMQCIAAHCPSLTELCIRSEDVTDHGVGSVVQHCTLLTSLTLDYNKQLTDTALREIAKHCKRLRTLSVVGCNRFTRLGLLVVLAKCTTLRHLHRTRTYE